MEKTCECKELRMAYLGQCRVCRLPIRPSKAIEPLVLPEGYGSEIDLKLAHKLNEVIKRVNTL